MWWFHGFWGWGALTMALVMIGFWVIIVWLLIAAWREGTGAPPPRPQSTAQQVLAERLARGEIDEAEYWRRLDVVHGRRHPSGTSSHRAV